MEIEKDRVIILLGVRNFFIIGVLIILMIENRDYENWKSFMDVIQCDVDIKKVIVLWLGYVDLVGCLKYEFDDVRNVLERVSVREIVIRVVVGVVCEEFLKMFGIKFYNYVIEIGRVWFIKLYLFDDIEFFEQVLFYLELFCIDKEVEMQMKQEIDIVR